MTHREFGAVFIVAGTAIGAGMLALPLTSAKQGFLGSAAFMMGVWLLSYLSAVNLVDINKKMKIGVTFPQIARESLGVWGEKITYFVFAIMHFALLAAYTDGAGQLLAKTCEDLTGIQLSKTYVSGMMAVVIFALIAFRTTIADKMNQLFFAAKAALFVFVLVVLMPRVEMTYLTEPHQLLMMTSIPVFFGAFGFQGSIPAILVYTQKTGTSGLKKIMFLGSIIPLIVYFLWEIICLGVIPLSGNSSFETVLAGDKPLALMIDFLSGRTGGMNLGLLIQCFTIFAVLTSFIGVGIALFHLLETSLQKRKIPEDFFFKRIGAGILAFLPPLIVVIVYPRAFVECLSFAGFMLAFIALFVPAMTRIKLYKKVDLMSVFLLLGFLAVVVGEIIRAVD